MVMMMMMMMSLNMMIFTRHSRFSRDFRFASFPVDDNYQMTNVDGIQSNETNTI